MATSSERLEMTWGWEGVGSNPGSGQIFFFGVVGAFEIQSFFTLSVNLEGQLPWYVINLIMADNLQAVDTHPDIPNAIVMIKRL